MSIDDPQQNISVKITFYFSILKQSILDFFENYPPPPLPHIAEVLKLTIL